MNNSLFEKLGGECRLRPIIDTFIDRVFDDRMIGFFFRNADRTRIKEMEYQLTAKFLGADIEYRGKPIGKRTQIIQLWEDILRVAGKSSRRLWSRSKWRKRSRRRCSNIPILCGRSLLQNLDRVVIRLPRAIVYSTANAHKLSSFSIRPIVHGRTLCYL